MNTEKNNFKFDAKGWDLFKLYLSNLLLTLVTLGVYYFWAKVKTKKFIYNHISFKGGRFDYHATGKEKLIAFLKGLLVIGIPLFLLFYGIPKLLMMLGIESTVAMIVPPLIFYLLIFLLMPAIIYGSQKFQLARTSWNSIHFRFNGNIRILYKMSFKGVLLSIITFGIYYFWFHVALKKYLTENSSLGNQNFNFDGKGEDLILLYLAAYFFVPLTLGIYYFFFRAQLERFYWNHTLYKENRFNSSITGWGIMKISVLGFLITIFTLGLGLPWAVILWNKYYIEDTLTLEGEVDISLIQSASDTNANAFAEGISESVDFLENLGDFFA